MSKGFDVVGVGHSCVDKICVVENYPKEDDSTHITSISVQGGGAVATALVALSRLGASTSFIGNVGSDSVSKEARDLFRMDGVDTSNMFSRMDCHGLESIVMVNPQNGSRTKFPMRDDNPPIVWIDDLVDVIKSAKILHLDGTNWGNAFKAASIAKENGVVVSLDGCSMQSNNDLNYVLASMADILIMNKKYPLRVSGKDNYKDALLEISTWGPKIVMCTLGENGVMAVINGEVVEIPAYKVSPILDTTGAGDVFHGAFLKGYLEGMDLMQNIKFASAVAALKCTKLGGRAGIPTREEALAILN